MNSIIAPRVTANEDTVEIAEILVDDNVGCASGDTLCVLISTKASFEVIAEHEGHVMFIVRTGDSVRAGQTIGYVSELPMNRVSLLEEARATRTADLPPDNQDVTRKARALLEKHNLTADQVPHDGVLRAADVEAYLSHLETRRSEKTIDPRYDDLERAMKSSTVDGITLDDVARLKGTLALAAQLYRSRWDRSIPALDVLFDRWAGAAQLGFGHGTNVSHLSYVIGDVRVGENTFIGPFTLLDGSGGLVIGKHCSIAAGVQIYSHDTIARALSGHRAEVSRSPTRIGDACFIGPNSVITRGVTIGDHCFIGANSVVTTDIPSCSSAQGVPAHIIGRVEVGSDGSVAIVPTRGGSRQSTSQG